MFTFYFRNCNVAVRGKTHGGRNVVASSEAICYDKRQDSMVFELNIHVKTDFEAISCCFDE